MHLCFQSLRDDTTAVVKSKQAQKKKQVEPEEDMQVRLVFFTSGLKMISIGRPS